MIEEEQKRNSICGKVFQEINALQNNDNPKAQLFNILEKESHYSTMYPSYELFILDFMFWACMNRKEEQAKDYFKRIFYEDLKNSPKFNALIPLIACDLVGIRDMVSISFDDMKTDHFFKRLFFDSEHDYELLIVGETGTGKQLYAKALHLMGNRNKKPFQDINCAAIPEQMLESELFGYEKGAFTGADKRKIGLIELAEDGIIFLDELGKMSKFLQAKI